MHYVKLWKIIFGFVALALCGAIAFFYLSNLEIAVLDPKGWIGMEQKSLLLVTTGLMLIVVIPVFVMTIWIVWKYRKSRQADYKPNWDHSTLLEVIWWGGPFVIIAILSVFTYKSCHQLDPFKPLVSDKKPLTIQAIALQWKWLFVYPEQKIATINYIQFPEKTPINFQITADAPMNSFWIPQLGGQVYAMAGMKTKLHLIADHLGEFRGGSAHLSGEGFAGMTFNAKAVTENEFEEWASSTRNSSWTLDWATYNELVAPSSYVPVSLYKLGVPNLYDDVVMKYMGSM